MKWFIVIGIIGLFLLTSCIEETCDYRINCTITDIYSCDTGLNGDICLVNTTCGKMSYHHYNIKVNDKIGLNYSCS